MELEKLHKETFAAYLQSDFQVLDDPGGAYTIRLVEVNERMSSPRQEVFALLFHGPADRMLTQATYRLNHSQIGEIELFLVPVGQDQDGYQYEAIFNRLVN